MVFEPMSVNRSNLLDDNFKEKIKENKYFIDMCVGYEITKCHGRVKQTFSRICDTHVYVARLFLHNSYVKNVTFNDY